MPHYVVSKVTDCLNDVGKAVRDSEILVLGVAYKEDIDDIRESPALDVMKLLTEKGGRVSYSDPFVPELTLEGVKMASQPLSPADIKRYDCLVITAAHSTFDYPAIVAAGVPIVDARNALKNHPAPHVRKI